mmetsp:Transcript_1054/g.3708  ORF Transcript_1054/g.3708 Transcript_1054/m.3708 type:complete len:420 (+) Transcript_1054:314-1573(+)
MSEEPINDPTYNGPEYANWDDFKAPKSLCVIGVAGFIGSHLLERLMYNSEYKVIGIDMVGEKIEHLLKPGQAHSNRLEFHKFDIRKPQYQELLEDCITRCDTVINLAAICNPAEYNTRPLDTIDSNFTDALPVIRICSDQQKHYIHFSTCEVYGKTLAGFAEKDTEFRNDPDNYMLREDDTMMILGPIHKQRWSYACAKQLVERVIFAEGTQNGLPFTIVRPFNWIGPRMDYIPGVDGPSDGVPRVLACFSTRLMQGKPLKLVDGGEVERTFVYVKDAVEAVVKMFEQPKRSIGRVFNVGNPDNEVTVRNLALLMSDVYSDVTGKAKLAEPTIDIPAVEFYGPGYDDCDKRVPDNSLIENQIDWKPTTSLKEALTTTLRWMEATFAEKLNKTQTSTVATKNVLPSKQQVEQLEQMSLNA